MSTPSAVTFPTPTRIHIALAVRDVSRAVAFYEAMLGQAPTKLRPGYAKFEVHDPPVNLALNETPEATAPPLPQHFGIQVQGREAIVGIDARLRDAGFRGQVEDDVTCCYAVQDKVWHTDPDGHRWEMFLVTQADTVQHSIGEVGPRDVADAAKTGEATEPSAPCCAPTCCA